MYLNSTLIVRNFILQGSPGSVRYSLNPHKMENSAYLGQGAHRFTKALIIPRQDEQHGSWSQHYLFFRPLS